ncbi:MAG: hypothetical protein KatS3mg011_1559 [Acidimicrobiia bacterium]|nr:MAG: hypothetical protein KatS3mg011_1559 [Acidimicrobiia bacterium]
MANRIVHFELMGPDAQTMRDFYRRMFGWVTQAAPGLDDYYLVDSEEAGIGGAVGKGPSESPTYQTIYVEVDHIDTALAKAEELGATTVVPRTEVPGAVTFALFSDPAGNLVGLVEAAPPPAP